MMRKAIWSTCVQPPRLKPGDTIAIPAPAGPVPADGFREGLRILESRYRVVYDDALLERTGFLAGSDERRADELNRYLADPDVRAVIAARGGYGVMRILDRLDPAALKRDPKIVVGFSDLTALLSWCVLEANVRPVHGPMAVQLGKLDATQAAWLFRLLEDPTPPGVLDWPLTRVGARGGGTVEGRLSGGNLEIVSRLVGTPWAFDLGAAVFLMEEVGERPYRVDRMLTQLRPVAAVGRRGDRGAAGRVRPAGGRRPAVWARRPEPGPADRRPLRRRSGRGAAAPGGRRGRVALQRLRFSARSVSQRAKTLSSGRDSTGSNLPPDDITIDGHSSWSEVKAF
jgi:muramoyltetrapeptide carboxypeptidase